MSMRVVITGGSGFLAAGLARQLLRRPECKSIVLADIGHHSRIEGLLGHPDVHFELLNLLHAQDLRRIITPDVTHVFHFASLVSGGAERDFRAGLEANVLGTINLLEACRLSENRPIVVFTSSIATFGGRGMPNTVRDDSVQHPQNSYGVAKVVGEQLLNDYSRKGFICGRGARLPAIVVRDEPNTAASGYASGIIREILHGREYVCPVSPGVRIPIMSAQKAVQFLLGLGLLPTGALGDWRTINAPGLSPTAGEMAEAACQLAGVPASAVRFEPNPDVERLVAAWPEYMDASRAAELGLPADCGLTSIISRYKAGIAALNEVA